MAVSEREAKRRGVLLAAARIVTNMLDQAETDKEVELACDFIFETAADHKRQRATELLEHIK